MGMNYFLKVYGEKCKECGRGGDEELHFGKSSCGCRFTMQQHPDRGLWDWPTWAEYAKKNDSVFVDEYGSHISMQYLKNVVFRINRVDDPGPNGEWRKYPSDDHAFVCRHPTEPIDYVQGDFS